MDSVDLYDEFGNFIGDGADSDADSSIGSQDNGDQRSRETGQASEARGSISLNNADENGRASTVTAPKTDKEEPFHGAETIFVDPTNEGGEEPVIVPTQEKVLSLEYKFTSQQELPETIYSKDYLKYILKDLPERIRNVAVVGNLHTGKTSLVDSLVSSTHPRVTESKKEAREFKPMRYSDTHKIERERGISIHTSAISLLLSDSKDRSYAFNILDTPGHPDFRDELLSSLNVAEGAIVVLDLMEGLTALDRGIVTEIVRRNLPFVVVLNKLDRLILEARLPTKDCFLKIKYVLDDLNSHVYHNEYIKSYTHEKLVSPLKKNVVFTSHNLGFSFNLNTWSRLYSRKYAGSLPDEATFAQLLWGDVFYENGKFSHSPTHGQDTPTTFEHFILEPVYKIVTNTIVSEPSDKKLATILWEQFGVSIPKSSYQENPQTLLKTVFSEIFSQSGDLVDSIVSNIQYPKNHVSQDENGVSDRELSDESAVAEIFKLSLSGDGKELFCLSKIHKGTLKVGDKVRVLGNESSVDKNDTRIEVIKGILIPVGRYNIEVEHATAGGIFFLCGISGSVSKAATLVSENVSARHLEPVHRSDLGKKSFYKVAIECEKPAELPRLIEGLQVLCKTYLSAITKLEESGERVLFAPGELYLDSFLHDLRYLGERYLSIRVSDPMVKFAETCFERSATKISNHAPSKKSSISIIAEPVNDKRLLRAIETGRISLGSPTKITAKILRDEFEWDALAARSLWAFGPKDMQNPSILLDDTIDGEVDKEKLKEAKDSIVAGFQMGVNEGPLCDEPIRRTKFKILDAVLNGGIQKSGSQLMPMTRNAVHSGLLTAVPKLLEPVYKVYVTCTYRSISAVNTILEKRRGWAVAEHAIPATQLYEIEGFVPIIDSVGLDTDMRLYTQGQAFCCLEFSKWNIVPGDPLDKDCALPQMKPVPRSSLARDFVMKTRKRKGLSGEPNLQKYIDPELFARLKESGIIG